MFTLILFIYIFQIVIILTSQIALTYVFLRDFISFTLVHQVGSGLTGHPGCNLSFCWYPSMTNMSVCFHWNRRCWGPEQPVSLSQHHQSTRASWDPPTGLWRVQVPVPPGGAFRHPQCETSWWRDTVSYRSRFWLCTGSSYGPGRKNRDLSPESERSSEWTHASRRQM